MYNNKAFYINRYRPWTCHEDSSSGYRRGLYIPYLSHYHWF